MDHMWVVKNNVTGFVIPDEPPSRFLLRATCFVLPPAPHDVLRQLGGAIRELAVSRYVDVKPIDPLFRSKVLGPIHEIGFYSCTVPISVEFSIYI